MFRNIGRPSAGYVQCKIRRTANTIKQMFKFYTGVYVGVLLVFMLTTTTLIWGGNREFDKHEVISVVDSLTVEEWLEKHGNNDLKIVFHEAGLLKSSLEVLNVKEIDKIDKLPESTKKNIMMAAAEIKNTKDFVYWLHNKNIPVKNIKRLLGRGLNSKTKLGELTNSDIQQICGNDYGFEEFVQLTKVVKLAAEGKVKFHEQASFSWGLFILKIVATIFCLIIGSGVLAVVFILECFRNFVNGLQRPNAVSRGNSHLSTHLTTPPQAGDGKNWLWKLFWSGSAQSLFPQSCIVKWNWEDPQVVGSTMSFTVKLFRKNGKPYVTDNTSPIHVHIENKGEHVACTKQLEVNEEDKNAIKTSFTVHKSGPYKISIMVSGRHIKGSPFTKSFEPGPIDAGRSGFTNYCSTIVCTAGSPYPLTIETQDSLGNPAIYKADQNNYFKIKVVETETSTRYVPATQLIYNPDRKQLTMHIKMEREGCYQATVSYGETKLKNGEFSILVINDEDMTHVNKNLSKKRHNIWYEARLLTGSGDSGEKAKRVYVYISPKQLTLKEYYFKVLGKKLYTWRVCPSTKFYFSGYNTRYDSPVMTIYDCSQPHITLAAKDRSVIAATFTGFLQKNIGGSETFLDKQAYFSQEVRKFQKNSTCVLKIDRSKLLYSSYKATRNFDASDWFKSFNICFTGEQGLDWGGLRREWFEIVCTELFDPAKSDYFRRFTCDSQGLVHPNGKRCSDSKLKYYEFAGKVVGKCLFDSAKGSAYRQLVKAKFSRSFLAQLIGLQVNYRYFETDDPELFKTKIKYIIENDIEDMELTFTEEEYSSDGQLIKVVDLIPNGSKTPVTNDNKLHYLNSLAQYRLASSSREEVEAFIKGLNLLIPDNLLSIFDENELELLLCGTGNYSMTDFKAHTVIDGSSYSFLKVLDWFWTVVASFTEEQMARLLQFTTGCSQLPAGGFSDLNPKFQISFSPTYNTLPTAHTCFNQLCLPDYDTMDNLHRSLLIALNEGSQGFGLV